MSQFHSPFVSSAPSRQLFHVFSIFFLFDLSFLLIIILLFCQDLEFYPQINMMLLARVKPHPF